MRVSIITAAYNAAPYIREALDSLLAQTLTDWECIVVDDGSTDDTARIVADYGAIDGRIALMRQTNQGQGFARNAGLANATGEYIIYLDADDILPTDYLANAAAHLDAHPDCALWYAPSQRFGINGRYEPAWIRWTGYRGLLRNNCIYISAVHRTADARRVGGFSVTRGFEDWDYWIRLLYGRPDSAVRYDTDCDGLIYREREGSAVKQDLRHDFQHRRAIRRRNKTIYDEYTARCTAQGNDPVMVVIPYLAEAAQGNELIWATRGWRQHFKEDFTLVVVGDTPPTGAVFDVWIECPRIGAVEGQYLPHLDMVHKFRKVREMMGGKGFIYTCDDIYPVNDFGLEDVLVPKVNQPEMSHHAGATGWEGDENKTYGWLREHGRATRGWICHLPVYMEWEKWDEVIGELRADTESYVVEEVYFNTYYATRPALLLNYRTDPYRCRIERADFDEGKLRDSLRCKTWVSNSVAGYTETLERIMNQYYGIE